jgi:glycerol kinase
VSRFVLALDEGTTSARAIAFDRAGQPVAVAQREFEQRYPAPGDVRHDPEQIWEAQLATAREVVEACGGPAEFAAVGVTNQRETTIVWERDTGRPVADAIVWQSRVTVPFCESLRARGLEPRIREKTGLPLDAYFSGPKIRHILESQAGLRARAERRELAFGTVESFLIWRLTGGHVHLTDVSNASRTLLLDLETGDWDDELLGWMEVPRAILPEIRSCSEVYGETEHGIFGRPIPIAGAAGDQQAATFGQACFEVGDAKTTLGTGAFLLATTGDRPIASERGLLTTVAWRLGPDAPLTYALEGSVFVTGAAVQWLRDGLGLIRESGDVEALAAGVADSGGVVFVPGFVGLGAPYWDPSARGLLIGLSRGTGRGEIARATLDAIAFQVRDVVEAIDQDLGMPLTQVRVDGGGAADLVCQLIADQVGRPVERPLVRETTALGAAGLAGLAVGFWKDREEFASAARTVERRFEPRPSTEERDRAYDEWLRAVERARGWVTAK